MRQPKNGYKYPLPHVPAAVPLHAGSEVQPELSCSRTQHCMLAIYVRRAAHSAAVELRRTACCADYVPHHTSQQGFAGSNSWHEPPARAVPLLESYLSERRRHLSTDLLRGRWLMPGV